MASRFTICLLFATWVGVSGSAWAQSMPFWQTQNGSPSQGYPAMPQFQGSPQSGYSPMAYNPEMMGDPSLMSPDPYAAEYAQASYLQHNAPIHEEIWDEERPIERVLSRVFSESYLRLEYLHWGVSEPHGALGARTEFAEDPYVFNPVFDNLSNLIGYAKVLDIDDLETDPSQGIRGTYGTRTSFGAIEANFWGLAENSSIMVADFLPDSTSFDPTNPTFPLLFPVPLMVATPTNLGGALSNNVFLWDLGYQAALSSEYFGSEFKVFFDQPDIGPGMTFQTLLGFQYVNARETLIQTGFSSAGNTGIIHSNVENEMYGPTLGFRSELQSKWLTVGVEPKVALALNSYDAVVYTNDFRSLADPETRSRGESTTFSPIMQLAVYAKFRVNDQFNLFLSFDGTWLSRMVRANKSINYNDNGDANPPAITFRQGTEGVFLNGITLGGEFILP